MEIEIRLHPVHDVSIVVLRPGAQHEVGVMLVFDAVFKSQREIEVRAKPNVLRRVEEVRAFGRI